MVALGLGLLLTLAGVILLFDVAGAAQAVMTGVTRRSLGSLAPGYAASAGGFRVYALLLVAFGIAVFGLGLSPWLPLGGVVLLVLGLAVFAGASIIAIRGEVRTYRALQRKS